MFSVHSWLNPGTQSPWIQRANCKSTCVKMDKMGFGCRYCQSGLLGYPDVRLASLLHYCLLILRLQAHTSQSPSLCCQNDLRPVYTVIQL